MPFTLFPQLPLELRLKIWDDISPGPRTVKIQMKYGQFNGKTISSFTGWTSSEPVPMVLQIYFNFLKDTCCNYLPDVFLGGGYHGANDSEKVESMVVNVSEELYERRNFVWNEIRLFTGLKNLTILVLEEDALADGLMRFYRSSLWRVKFAHPEWKIPVIVVGSAETGTAWGSLKMEYVEY